VGDADRLACRVRGRRTPGRFRAEQSPYVGLLQTGNVLTGQDALLAERAGRLLRGACALRVAERAPVTVVVRAQGLLGRLGTEKFPRLGQKKSGAPLAYLKGFLTEHADLVLRRR